MSEKIKISVVIDDEKTNAEKKGKVADALLLTQDSAVTLMPVLLQNRLMNGSFCGGRGDCGRCVVQFLEGTPLPTGLERARLTPEELRQGYRLACVTRPKGDCTVRVPDRRDAETPIVTEMNLPSEDIDLTGWQKNNRYMIAVDLGTTTIAMQLRDMVTGEVADTYCEKNPQRIYGTDVLARIEASCNGKREELKSLVCESLLRGLRQFTAYLRQKREAGNGAEEAVQIICMCIAGNTTMEHLLMGYDVESLGRAPFVPVETGLQCISGSPLFFDFPVYIAPCISAFVGGDIVAGLYALRMRENTKTTLLIDLGTNGEMAITDGRRMIVTATAAGPAFEGSGDLIGTDRIALTADLLRRGILDETGLLAEPWFEEGVCIEEQRETATAGDRNKNRCYLYKEDIRALQMAKAAVRAGVEILWEEMGRPKIDCIYLAGGFGYYLDVEAAFAIGLLPSYMRGRVQAVGNTSLAGAYALGRDLCEGRTEKEILEKTLSDVESINLAKKENFEKLYLKYMNLGEN